MSTVQPGDVQPDREFVPVGVDATRPNVARMYDHWLGGEVNYEVDRRAADRVSELEPLVRHAAWANRGFLQRAARWIASQGVDQFVDLGAGLPTMNNTHDVVQLVNPSARVLYVDSDPEVVAHSMHLVGNLDLVYYIQGDVRRPDEILSDPTLLRVLDLDRPVGLLMVGLLYFVAEPDQSVAELVNAMAPGSYLALSHVTGDHQDPAKVAEGRKIYNAATEQMYPRSRDQVQRFFAGLEFIAPYHNAAPGLCYVGQWGAEDPQAADDDAGRWLYAGVARRHSSEPAQVIDTHSKQKGSTCS